MRILKQFYCAEKREINSAFFIIQLGAENQDNHRGDPLATSKNFGKKSHTAEKNSETKPWLSCLVTEKALETMVSKGGTRDCFLVS